MVRGLPIILLSMACFTGLTPAVSLGQLLQPPPPILVPLPNQPTPVAPPPTSGPVEVPNSDVPTVEVPTLDAPVERSVLLPTEPAPTRGTQSLDPPANRPPANQPVPQVHPLSDLATGIVRQTIPETFDGDDNWGETTRMLDGWKFEREGILIKTKRRWKEVNHGTWIKYEVTPVNPDAELLLKIVSIKPADGGKLAVTVSADSPIHAVGRLAEWRYDVQLASLEAEATAMVHVDAVISLAPKLDTNEFPPAVMLVPKVESAKIVIDHFKLRRVSKVGGPLIHVLSGGLERAITAGLDQKQNKIVAALNKKIEAKQDRFKVSLNEMAKNQWGDLREFISGE